ncbi:MAG: nucleotide exchange factor GrpE [Actinomycetota bacterium]|nr:nucleotide exchange factor GrpE [Actinomycetota bacterium]
MTDDRDRDEAPVIKVTDKRRFAKLAEADGPERPSASGSNEPGTNEPAADELAEARAKADEYLQHLQRLQAEFDNYRKRVLREQTTTLELASEPVMRRLLEVLDEFELALLHAHEDVDRDRFLKGIELVYAKLMDALKAEGLQRIDAEGAPFDPNLHEALMQTGEGNGEPHVAEVFRPGYTLKGRVLRPAGVRVERT